MALHEKLGLQRQVLPVSGIRKIGKKNLAEATVLREGVGLQLDADGMALAGVSGRGLGRPFVFTNLKAGEGAPRSSGSS